MNLKSNISFEKRPPNGISYLFRQWYYNWLGPFLTNEKRYLNSRKLKNWRM
jgi:hypothetical protein